MEVLCDWIKVYLQALAISLIICIVTYFSKGFIFLDDFIVKNMIQIQIALIAINIPSLCILINNVSSFIKKINMNKEESQEINLTNHIRTSFFENLMYIFFGLISLIIYEGISFEENIFIKYVSLGFSISFLIMSIATIIDSFKAILVIYDEFISLEN